MKALSFSVEPQSQSHQGRNDVTHVHVHERQIYVKANMIYLEQWLLYMWHRKGCGRSMIPDEPHLICYNKKKSPGKFSLRLRGIVTHLNTNVRSLHGQGTIHTHTPLPPQHTQRQSTHYYSHVPHTCPKKSKKPRNNM